jgi:hypothetical protein
MASMEMLQIFEVMSDSVNTDGVCVSGKELRERLGQLNPEDDLRFFKSSANVSQRPQNFIWEELGLQK